MIVLKNPPQKELIEESEASTPLVDPNQESGESFFKVYSLGNIAWM